VIDDCSTDGSWERLNALKAELGFNLVVNPSNLGKSKTLNDHFRLARHEVVVLVDADVIVSRKPLEDAVARLQRMDVGAVSCPYRCANRGFIPLMQTIEYNMLSFVQGAYNLFSAIALWGGFIVIKRTAFLQAGGFTPNAITEDMDLAFKLNQIGWRVEQSFYPIHTYAPDTLRKWYKQKIRWSSGGLQCFVKHYKVWLKNPLHVLSVYSFCILLTSSALKMGEYVLLWDEIYRYFDDIYRDGAFWLSLKMTGLKYGVGILKDLVWRIAFTLFSLPFVLPLVSTLKRLPICFLVIPFSMVYGPLFSSISMLGTLYYLQKRRRLRVETRAWYDLGDDQTENG
jgi:cellulose synthase/poly-beta-1,6-N-acetylglucosamine synthase-like glycosyltransferase